MIKFEIQKNTQLSHFLVLKNVKVRCFFKNKNPKQKRVSLRVLDAKKGAKTMQPDHIRIWKN